ncbi:unnamed protein product [Brassicogethes aeneus]|uniref:Carboxylic ester hydrolase n=1 Tax=Brassicogethes aeneus TaxID=1431903 RepID=A0A9P0BEA0_BRAAE|nr:unnamed protein product [Brassicogethes aeneus]
MVKLVGVLTVLTVFILYYSAAIAEETNLPIVELSDGQIEGREFPIDEERKYYGFIEIPYAKPPIGDLRFKEPLANDKWEGIRKSPFNAAMCMQKSEGGSEDCLFVNVFSPDLSKKNLPVMVWLHGGAFIYGSSSEFSPKYLMETGEVMVVTLNYRLNVFGFLSTGDSVVPGNMGLKDQLLALKWVQKNIENFGGDPNKVTIFGQSAGAASVSYLMQSPKSEGLFHRAIMQSGSSLCAWALYRNAGEQAKYLGEKLQLNTESSDLLVEDLRALSAVDLQKQSASVYLTDTIASNILNGHLFVPVIEPESETAFFTEKSHQLLLEGRHHRIPTIVGYNSLEAKSADILPEMATEVLQKYEYPENLVPAGMNVTESITKMIAGLKIKLKYFGLGFASLSPNSDLLQFISDDQFSRAITEMGSLLSKYANTYFYIFSYEGILPKSFKRNGVGHFEELPYIVQVKELPEHGLIVRQRMVRLWVNFAVTGNPTPTENPLLGNVIWKPMSKDNEMSYLNIDTDLKVKNYPTKEEVVSVEAFGAG